MANAETNDFLKYRMLWSWQSCCKLAYDSVCNQEFLTNIISGESAKSKESMAEERDSFDSTVICANITPEENWHCISEHARCYLSPKVR